MSDSVTSWNLSTIAGVSESIIGGGTPSRERAANWDGQIPWVTPGELTKLDGHVVEETREKITDTGFASSSAKVVPAGSLLVTTRATIGVVAIAGVSMTTNQGIKAIVLSPSADPKFYFHLLQTLRPELVRRASGTTFLEISAAEFANIEVPQPSLHEQRCVAAVLDSVDSHLAFSRQRMRKLDQIRTGLLDDCVSSFTSDLVPLANLVSADICYGIVQSGSYVSDGVPVLAIRDLTGDFSSGLHRTSPAIAAQYRRSRVSSDDILVSIKGTIGRVGIVPSSFEGNISRDLALLRFGSRIRPRFAHLYLQSRITQRRLDLSIVGTTRAEISIHQLKKFCIAAPPLSDQDRLIEAMSGVEAEISAQRRAYEKWVFVKQGLAADLLSGRVRIPAGITS